VKIDAYSWFAKTARDDVRWQKVEHIKRIMIGGTYAVPARRVAAKIVRHMLEHHRATHRGAHRIKLQLEGGWGIRHERLSNPSWRCGRL
jgi:hypothetical protein